jgi:hypoxanthine phosphoribosyltransferase
MVPIKAWQLDYQDFANLVWEHLSLIEDYQQKHELQFDIVLGKLRNGVISASIIANALQLPMGIISAPRSTKFTEYEDFIPKDILKKKKINILYVDNICGTGQTLEDITKYLFNKYQNKIHITSYVTLVDKKTKTKPDIIGYESEKFFQPPWEWKSFTPQSHLDRLENNNIKASDEKENYIGFSSSHCKEKCEQALSFTIKNNWIDIFELEQITTQSKISSISIPSKNLDLQEAKNKYAPLIEKKVQYILDQGFTYFIEEDLIQALLLSEKCPVTKIIYLQDQYFYKIYGKQQNKQNIQILFKG